MSSDKPGSKLDAKKDVLHDAWDAKDRQKQPEKEQGQSGKSDGKSKFDDLTKEFKPRGDMAEGATEVDKTVRKNRDRWARAKPPRQKSLKKENGRDI